MIRFDSFHLYTIAGLYLMFIMISSALWLILTVGILNIHHKNPGKNPPKWMEYIATHILVRLACMGVPKDKNDRLEGSKKNYYAQNHNTKKDSFIFNNDHSTESFISHATFAGDQKSTENKCPERKQKFTWIKLAKIFDRFCLVLFSVIDVLAIVIFLCFYPSSGIEHPSSFPREQMFWNLSDSKPYDYGLNTTLKL